MQRPDALYLRGRTSRLLGRQADGETFAAKLDDALVGFGVGLAASGTCRESAC